MNARVPDAAGYITDGVLPLPPFVVDIMEAVCGSGDLLHASAVLCCAY
jgi:hypothetical protein